MKNSRHDPRMVTLDLINDMILRLDSVLDALNRRSRDFAQHLRSDPGQGTRGRNTPDAAQVNFVHPDLQRLLNTPQVRTSSQEPRAIQQVLLDLHVLHAQLGKLIDELERVHGLEACPNQNDLDDVDK
jgi:hypothetical protein